MNQNYLLKIWAAAFILLCLISFSFSANAQTEHETVLFNGITYYKISGSYYLLDDIGQELIPISSSKITLKYNEGVTQAQIESFEFAHSLDFERRAVTGWCDYSLGSPEDLLAQVQTMQASELVELVEVCGPISLHMVPNDPRSYETSTQTWLSWGIQRTELDEAWNKTTGDPSIVVAFLDSGVDWWHEDFAQATGTSGTFWLNPGEDAWSDPNDPTTGDGIDNDNNGYIDDWRGWNFADNTNDITDFIPGANSHGTGVIGIAAGRSNNAKGVAGVAGGWGTTDGIKVMPLKLMTWGVHSEMDKSLITDDAIEYAAKNGARIICFSGANYTNIASISAAIEWAYNSDDYNCTVISSAGNMGNGQPLPVLFPASHPLVLAIGGSNDQDRLYKSHAGPNLDLIAPGDSCPYMRPNDSYGVNLGTSFASPFVAGVAGLMLSVNPCLNNEEIGNILKRRADQVHKNNPINPYNYNIVNTKPGHSNMAGYGRVNAKRAVNTAEAMKENTLDLYIKDHYSDFGWPSSYPANARFDDWSDIWVRNQNDGHINREMEEIEYSTSQPAYVYVRVRNKSCVGSSGNDSLNVYWTKSSTASSWPQNWNGSDTAVGNVIGKVLIPPLAAGEDTILEFAWPITYQSSQSWGMCIMARIVSADDPITPDENLALEIRNNNNIAIRNLQIMDIFPGKQHPYFDGRDYPYGIKIYSGSTGSGGIEPVYIRFDVPQEYTGGNLAEEAELKLFLSEEMWQVVLAAGSGNWHGLEVAGEKEMLITSSHAELTNLQFPSNERYWYFFGFNFLTEEVTETYTYRYHITQYNNGEEMQGAMNFTVNRQPREDFEADAGPDQFIYQGQTAQAHATDINEPATYNWYDSKDSLIYSGKSPALSPTVTEKYKLEVIADADLYKDYDEIKIKVNPYAITSLTPNPASVNLTIGYDADEANSAYLILQPVIGGGSSNHIVSTTHNQTTISVGSYSPGIYAVLLVCDGEIVDSEMLTIQ